MATRSWFDWKPAHGYNPTEQADGAGKVVPDEVPEPVRSLDLQLPIEPWISWDEWKANMINRIFDEHRIRKGRPLLAPKERITAATVRHGRLKMATELDDGYSRALESDDERDRRARARNGN